ncbi:MAG TPA: efflux RND transporter permease subunit, partial [Planctomycetes bacterium]|nr:efflux RND transporter permease subunit [Planctomycetota bacterium]
MWLVRSALRYPYLVLVLALAVVSLGSIFLTRIPSDLLPIFRTPAVQIVTFYNGMPPEVVEGDISSRMQRWTGQSVGISHQEAKSMTGVSIVKDFFREDISMESAMSQVTSYAMSDLFYLPPGTIPPMVMPFDPTASVPLCLVSVSSETMSEQELYDVAYFELRNRLQSIRGVIAPAVYGGVLRRIFAYLDREELEARQLSPMDVVRAIQEQNVFIPTGNAKLGDLDYMITTNAMVDEISELNDLLIKIEDGKPVFLRDVARAENTQSIQTNVVRINGRRQVYIPIYRQPGANTIEIVNEIRTKLTQIRQRVVDMYEGADDVLLEVVMDQSIFVRNSISALEHEGLIGAFLAGLIVLLFIGSVRSMLIILLSLPLSALAAFIGLYLSGNTINSMTLGGLALAVGLIVDQAIVTLENISRHLSMGKTPVRAAYDGASEVAGPIFVATITIMVVFFPVVLLSGISKFLFTPLAISVILAMGASYLVALTIVPLCCARFLKAKPGADSATGEHEPAFFRVIGRNYAALLERVLQRKMLVGISTLIFFLISLGLVPGIPWSSVPTKIGQELFPATDSGQFTIFVRAPSGTRIEATERLIESVENEIQDVIGQWDPRDEMATSDLQMLISNIGVLMDWPAAYTPNTGPMDTFMLVQLKENRSRSSIEYSILLRERLVDRFPGIEFAFDTGGILTAALNFGLPSPIDIQVTGSKLEVGQEIARTISDEVRQVDGAVDVRVAQRLDYPSIHIVIDRVKAAYLGITPEEIVKNIITATNSSVTFNPSFWIDKKKRNHYFIGAQYPEGEINSFATLENIPIRPRSGDSTEPVLLRNIATFERTTGPTVVNHVNITRVTNIYSNVVGRDVGSVVSDIEQR